MVTKVPLSTDVTDPICLVPFLSIIFRGFGTAVIRLVNAVDILTLELNVVNTGKIGEESYNSVSIEARDSTQSSPLSGANVSLRLSCSVQKQIARIYLYIFLNNHG
ncbi:hypothetical protein AVEN_40679-1 [Araneus ventricosus]|uniref:Uncharacterized protein n=1 Tax=Araneus ventricosus TaxID=182803 RepID=A0A4Y2KZT5_ARAVE|nr:hypothetical protein AVEN_40679-1 [Araneus ventricosus]